MRASSSTLAPRAVLTKTRVVGQGLQLFGPEDLFGGWRGRHVRGQRVDAAAQFGEVVDLFGAQRRRFFG